SGGKGKAAKTDSSGPVQPAMDAPEPAAVPAAVGAASDSSAELENEGPWLLDMVTDDAGDKEPDPTK
ncbi:MAG TPA: hypothetical protein VEV43_15500, partial [Actinomycetota bacterium]|nr:hypothetical protein [Actinomycetota bacterium]